MEVMPWETAAGVRVLGKEETFAVLRRERERGALWAGLVAERTGPATVLWYALLRGNELRIYRTVTEPDGSFPSVTPLWPAAHWDEREAADTFGLTPTGHPDPRPLIRAGDPYPYRTVEGEGVVVMPVGPVHAGLIESGHFHFSLMGERILGMDLRLFYNHRAIEKMVTGMEPEEAAVRVSRICGADSLTHQVGLFLAVAEIAAEPPPPQVSLWLTALLEWERLISHTHDLAALPVGTGYAVANQEGLLLKEELLRQTERLLGHRYGFDLFTRRPRLDPSLLTASLGPIGQRWRHFRKILEEHAAFRDRLRGPGRISPQAAERLGAVGPTGRASGIPFDLRSDRPYLAYAAHPLEPVSEEAGDVEARFLVRVREAEASLRWLGERSRDLLPLDLPPLPTPGREGAAWVALESPRGMDSTYLHLDGEGRILRYHLRSASFANWPLLMMAVRENMLADFPLINKSLELCYACTDR